MHNILEVSKQKRSRRVVVRTGNLVVDLEQKKIRAKEYRETWNKKNPWDSSFKNIKNRVSNPKCESYVRYGGRGIKCLITNQELKKLWFRDKAYMMKRPSIDRKDSDKDYYFENCRFIELSLNSRLGGLNNPNAKKKECPRNHPFSGKNLYISKSGGYEARVCRECMKIHRTKYNRRIRSRVKP